ncbi:MAG: sigma-70 family RNA polymerase sigma factor [Clostridia bacterium]|nr:sigma-70 family RNA polymerase sigma factor [Clostridia bacterium]
MNDNDILTLLEQRSEDALPALAEQYGRLIAAIARNILRSEEDTEECVNDTWLKIWNSIPPAKPTSLRSYAAMTARGLAINRWQSAHAAKRGKALPLDELGDCMAASGTPSEAVEAKELAAAINGFLGTLDAASRQLFVRRYWYCDSPAALAERFGIRERAVNLKLFRIRKKLCAYLERRDFL